MAKRILFLFHMHQPYYKDTLTGDCFLPWVRLHGVKGYFDIPYLADKVENAVFTVNLVPSLIEQLIEYSEGKLTDKYLELTLKSPSLMSKEEKLFVIDNFFSVNKKNAVLPNPEYARLYEKRGDSDDREALLSRLNDFSENEIRDLQALFNLAWFGFAAEKEYPLIKELKKKGKGYSDSDIKQIVDIQFEILKRLIPLYKRLYLEGKIELTLSPYFHPILPLIINTDTAKRCMDKPLPERFSYPAHAEWHVREGIEFFEKVFGKKPFGMWPSEGSVSPEVLDLLAESGIKWAATDQGILEKSLGSFERYSNLYSPYLYKEKIFMFFRDRELSDKIGFVYYNMDTDRAVLDFLSCLKKIENERKDKNTVVPVILDGENPWENYKESGYPFLENLFQALKEENWECATFSRALHDVKAEKLEYIHSGSWINSDFAIWIGHEETNRAWSYLKKAAEFFENKAKSVDNETFLKAKKELMIAEGSDWFWWYGDDFQVKDQDKFDFLFLKHLSNVYRIMGEQAPDYLKTPIKKIAFNPVKLPSCVLSPELDGKIFNYFEWSGSGVVKVQSKGDAMYKGESVLKEIRFGRDEENCYFLINTEEVKGKLTLFFKTEFLFKADIVLNKGFFDISVLKEENGNFIETGKSLKVAIDKVVEVLLPAKGILSEKESLKLAVELSDGTFYSRVPDFGFVDTGMSIFLPSFFFCSFDF